MKDIKKIVDMLNEELEEIRNQVAEEADVKATKAMFEKINKGLGLAK